MTYYDSSALVKRYVAEAGRAEVDAMLGSDPRPLTSALTIIEVRRAISRTQSPVEAAVGRMQFTEDLGHFDVIGLDSHMIEAATVIAEQLGVRTLDAIHLAAALRVGSDTLVSFDSRQRSAASAFGLSVYPADAPS